MDIDRRALLGERAFTDETNEEMLTLLGALVPVAVRGMGIGTF